MSKRICTAITIFIFSVTMFSEGIVFAATPTTPTNECKNFEKHLEQYESFEQMPAGLQNVYSECEGITVPKSNQTFNASDAQCEWVDELGRSRKEWHKDVKDGKLTNLYKRCYSTGNDGFEVDKYSLVNPHPGCKGIINAYEKQSSKKEINAKGLTKNYKNCTTYGTPYPQLVVPDPSLADLAANLQADGSIRINNDELFTESQTVTLTLAPNAPPEKMQFSNDGQTWTNWEVFTGTKDWLITNNNAGQKTVYVRYKTGTTVSQADSDAIMLLAKYGATYSTANLSNSWAKSRTQLINVTLKNTGYLTWDSSDPQYPVQLTYRWLAPNGEIAEEYGNYAMFDQTIAYGEVVEVPLLVRAPKTAGNYVLEVDLEEWGVTNFSQMGVLSKKMPITITDEALPQRSTVQGVEALPFGIGGYTALENEPTPDVITACESNSILYEMSSDQTVFTVEYIVPYGRTINNVYDVWVDGDNTAFYEVDYNEYLNDSRRLFLYRDSAVESDMCSEEAEQFPNIRECENLYPDVAGVSNESCLDITKATASKWVSGYESGDFGPADLMIRAEFAKLIIGATEIPLLAHPEGVAIFSDIDPNGNDWFKDYAYTAFEAGLMSRDMDGRFSPMTQITFNDAVGVTLSAFDLSLNSCNYSVIYSGNETIGAGLFYGLIEYNKVPASPTLGKISREYAVHMLVNAYAQASHLSANPPLCPKSAGDIVPPADNIKQICGTEQPVKLSSTPSLTRNLGTLLNGVQVEVLDAQNLYTHVSVVQTGATGYVSLGELIPSCDIPTPPMPLITPNDGEAVVASIVGIYAHTKAQATSDYVDVNGDGNQNSQDVIPYNVSLNVLEVKDNWLRVRFTGTDGGTKEGWVYSGFLVLGDGVVIEQRTPKTMATVDWAHQMTVDLRTDPSENAASIIWETYGDTRVQVIEKDDDSPFYFVKIEVPSRDLSSELIEENYGRLYMGMADLSALNGMAIGLSGWVHEEFMNEDGVNYATPLAYPFEYDSESAVDSLVNQIFYEEVMGEVHKATDYNLEEGAAVKSVAAGIVHKIHTANVGDPKGLGNYVVVKHNSGGLYSIYGHLSSIQVTEDATINQGDAIGIVGGDSEYDNGSGEKHLHFELNTTGNINDDDEAQYKNPTKYIGNYNSQDSNICMRELVVKLGMRDGDLIADLCNAGVGAAVPEPRICTDFTDIYQEQNYCIYLNQALSEGWIKGYPDLTFKPDNSVNRAEFSKMLVMASTDYSERDLRNMYSHVEHVFPDIDYAAWYGPYVYHLYNQGIIEGYADGTFKPDNKINFAEALKMVIRTYDSDFDETVECLQSFEELAENHIGEWYTPYLVVALKADILDNSDKNKNGDSMVQKITRAQTVEVVIRARNSLPFNDEFCDLSPEELKFVNYINDNLGLSSVIHDSDGSNEFSLNSTDDWENNLSVYKWHGVWVQEFSEIYTKDKYSGYDGIAILNPNGQIYLVKNGMWDKYKPSSTDSPLSPLGLPTSNEEDAATSQYNTQGAYQKFENGTMYWSEKYGAYTVYGSIGEKYENLNGTWSFFGFPIDDPQEDENGYYQKFEGGNLYADKNGAFVVPYAPLVRQDVCGLGPSYDYLDKPKWEDMILFNNDDDEAFDRQPCPKMCEASGTSGCHLIALAMVDAFYNKNLNHPNGHDFDLQEYNNYLENAGANDFYTGGFSWKPSCLINWEKAINNIKTDPDLEGLTNDVFLEFDKSEQDIKFKDRSFVITLDSLQNNNHIDYLDKITELNQYINKGRPIIIQVGYSRIDLNIIDTSQSGQWFNNHAFVIVGKDNNGNYLIQDEYYPNGENFVTLKSTLEKMLLSKSDMTAVGIRKLIFYKEK